MTELQNRKQVEADVRRPWLRTLGVLAAAVFAVVFSVVLVLLTPWFGHPTVSDRADQQDVAFGMPIAWVHQDQSSLDPPFPWQTEFVSPLEHPTTVSAGAFLVDVLIVLAAVAVLLGLLVVAVRLLRVSRRA